MAMEEVCWCFFLSGGGRKLKAICTVVAAALVGIMRTYSARASMAKNAGGMRSHAHSSSIVHGQLAESIKRLKDIFVLLF